MMLTEMLEMALTRFDLQIHQTRDISIQSSDENFHVSVQDISRMEMDEQSNCSSET